jgi:hypothetical protein
MGYPNLAIAEVSRLEQEYKALEDSLPTKKTKPEKSQVEAKMRDKARLAQTRLANAISGAARYYNQHHEKAGILNREAQNFLKIAQDAAAAYRKTPTNAALKTAVEHGIAEIGKRKAAYDADSLAYGAAWDDFRKYNPAHFPKEVVADFKLQRMHLVNSQQATVVLVNQIVAAKNQAEALISITDKATMKKDIKQGGTQRPITDAQQAAKDVALKLAAELKELLIPTNITNKPDSIKSGATNLDSFVKGPPKNWNELVQARGIWSGVDSAYKSMVARSAAMDKMLATLTRGFRTNELSDKTVKAELAKAATSVKDAKATVKKYDKDYATAKKLMDKVNAQAVKDGLH